MTTVTANGRAYSDDGTTPRDVQNGGHRIHLLPMLADVLVEVANAKGYRDASAASAAAASAVGSAFACTASAPANMSVKVGAGSVFDGVTLTQRTQQASSIIVKPVANPRIDRIVADDLTGLISVIAGVEAAAPVAPAIPAGKFPIARIALTTATASITDAMITDERAQQAAAIMPTGGAMSGALTVQPATVAAHPVTAGQLQAQSLTAFTTAGAAPALTLAPSPPLTAYAAGQRFRVKLHAAGADTINVSGLGAKSLRQYDSTGAKIPAVTAVGQLADIEHDGVDWVILDPLPAAQPVFPAIAGVRQTVLSGAVDGSGFASILSVGAGLVPKLLANIIAVSVAFAAGFGSAGAADYVGTVVADASFPACTGSQIVSSATNATSCVVTTSAGHNLVVGALVTLSGFTPTGYNGTYKITAVTSNTFTIALPAAPGAVTVIGSYTVTNFLYVDRNPSTGALTLGTSLLMPSYQFGAASTVNGQHTFVISAMQMYVGTGATASAVQRVFVGDCQASSAAIGSTSSYAFNGVYHAPLTALPVGGVRTLFNHNIGVSNVHLTAFKECTTAGDGYALGDRAYIAGDGIFGTANIWYGVSPSADYKTLSLTTGVSGANFVINKLTGVAVATPISAWSIGAIVQRGF